jgi:hypothetical protein
MNTDKSETPFHETFLGSDTETKQEQYDSDCPFGEGGFSPSSAPPMPEDSSVPSYLKISDENVQDVLFEEPVAEPPEEQKSELLKSDYKIVNGVIVELSRIVVCDINSLEALYRSIPPDRTSPLLFL